MNAGQFFNPNFKSSITKLLNHPFSVKTTLKLVKLTKKLEAEEAIINDVYRKKLELYTELDDGKVKTDNNGYIFKSKEDKEKFLKEVDELFGSLVNIDIEKIDLSNEDIKLSPMELVSIEDIVTFGE